MLNGHEIPKFYRASEKSPSPTKSVLIKSLAVFIPRDLFDILTRGYLPQINAQN